MSKRGYSDFDRWYHYLAKLELMPESLTARQWESELIAAARVLTLDGGKAPLTL